MEGLIDRSTSDSSGVLDLLLGNEQAQAALESVAANRDWQGSLTAQLQRHAGGGRSDSSSRRSSQPEDAHAAEAVAVEQSKGDGEGRGDHFLLSAEYLAHLQAEEQLQLEEGPQQPRPPSTGPDSRGSFQFAMTAPLPPRICARESRRGSLPGTAQPVPCLPAGGSRSQDSSTHGGRSPDGRPGSTGATTCAVRAKGSQALGAASRWHCCIPYALPPPAPACTYFVLTTCLPPPVGNARVHASLAHVWQFHLGAPPWRGTGLVARTGSSILANAGQVRSVSDCLQPQLLPAQGAQPSMSCTPPHVLPCLCGWLRLLPRRQGVPRCRCIWPRCSLLGAGADTRRPLAPTCAGVNAPPQRSQTWSLSQAAMERLRCAFGGCQCSVLEDVGVHEVGQEAGRPEHEAPCGSPGRPQPAEDAPQGHALRVCGARALSAHVPPEG